MIKPWYTFKSRQPFFDKEKAGIKNNTVREIDLNEDKFLELIQHMMNGFNDGDIRIEICNAENPDNNFFRDITDISVYNHLMVITWKSTVSTGVKK